jgi:hypothetical protein
MNMPLHGECIGPVETVQVVVSDLKCDGCELVALSGRLCGPGAFSLWIGAIGPLAVTLTGQGGTAMHAHFEQLLDNRIVDHFSCSSGPRPRVRH